MIDDMERPGGADTLTPDIVTDQDDVTPRFEYTLGVFLTPRVTEIPKYEKAGVQVAIWSDWVSMGAMIVLLAMTFGDVLLRTFFNAPFAGMYDWTRYLMVLIATFGMPLCTMNDEHVCIDFIYRKFPLRLQAGLTWMCYVIVAFMLVVYITQDWAQGIFNAGTGQTSIGVPWPTYPFYYFISIGFACMLVIVIVKAINLAKGVK